MLVPGIHLNSGLIWKRVEAKREPVSRNETSIGCRRCRRASTRFNDVFDF